MNLRLEIEEGVGVGDAGERKKDIGRVSVGACTPPIGLTSYLKKGDVRMRCMHNVAIKIPIARAVSTLPQASQRKTRRKAERI